MRKHFSPIFKFAILWRIVILGFTFQVKIFPFNLIRTMFDDLLIQVILHNSLRYNKRCTHFFNFLSPKYRQITLSFETFSFTDRASQKVLCPFRGKITSSGQIARIPGNIFLIRKTQQLSPTTSNKPNDVRTAVGPAAPSQPFAQKFPPQPSYSSILSSKHAYRIFW